MAQGLRLKGLVGGILAVVSDVPAWSDPGVAAAPSLLAQVLACRSVAERQRRLACYDGAVSKLDEATANHEVVVYERKQMEREREADFGLARSRKPALPKQERGSLRSDRKTYDGTIATVVPTGGYRIYLLRLTDGSVWRTIEAGDPPAPAQPIHITRGLIGNYLANIKGQRAIRLERVR